jgi:hypothetical protein
MGVETIAMRAVIAKRIRQNILKHKPTTEILIELTNFLGERSKDMEGEYHLYKAGKAAYKFYRRTGQHKKAQLFINENIKKKEKNNERRA